MERRFAIALAWHVMVPEWLEGVSSLVGLELKILGDKGTSVARQVL